MKTTIEELIFPESIKTKLKMKVSRGNLKGYIIFSVCNKKRYMHFFHNKKTYKENLDTM